MYNLGILACGYGSYSHGVAGEVVSKQQLKLNFARNDIMSDCPVWRLIKETLDSRSEREVKSKKTLSDAERRMLAKRMASGSANASEASEWALFTDVTGRRHNLQSLRRKGSKFRKVCTSVAKGDSRGDKLMQLELAFVFAKECLDMFGVETLQELFDKVILPYDRKSQFKLDWTIQPYASLTPGLDDEHRHIDSKKWTAMERVTLQTIARAQEAMIPFLTENRIERRIFLGEAGCALAWTDGFSSVFFDRTFLGETGTEVSGWVTIGLVLLHELCHDAPDSATHYHSPEFYEMYHDSHKAVGAFVERAMEYYGKLLALEGKRLTKKQLIEQDRLTNQRRLEEALTTASAQADL